MVDPHTGRWYTVGDTGAEFVNIPRGAIVFNHKQTESLLKNGYATSRASALVGGTAMVTGGISSKSFKSSSSSSSKSSSSSSSKSSSNLSSKSSSSSSSEKETVDWIEIAIDRIERAIDRLKTIATSAYKSLKTRLSATSDEIEKVNKEIVLQQQAYNRYIKEANSVGLSSSLATKVRNGSIQISEYNEDTQELIKKYQDWYEKALDCSDVIQELHESLAELYEDNFNDVQEDYESQLDLLEHLSNTYENTIDALEAKGYLESTKIYAALQDVEKQNIDTLNKSLVELTQAFSTAMASGEIEEYSEAWYDMTTAINDTEESIQEANVSLLEYAQTMREIEWGYFDFIQERISQLTSESDYLIELMSNSNLYTDKGQFSDLGIATMGLHAMNYNVYMEQAEQYAEEMRNIEKQLADDPYNTDLIERKEELLKLQQESIIAAEDEKQAIVDLVEEGISVELDSLKELIDAYTESLDSAKDLYDYERKISEQTRNISDLRKQLAAYENDLSEETRAKVQKLTVEFAEANDELEETQWEQQISDQKKLLNELYDEYELILNQRLDNVDTLIGDMITTANENTNSINATLIEVSDNVGYTMTDNMQSIWNGSTEALNGTLSVYGDGFNEQLTAINIILSRIQATIATMEGISDSEAEDVISSTTATITPTSSDTPNTSDASESVSNESNFATDINVGGKINAKGTKIYNYPGDKTGEKQYYNSDPIYTVLAEKSGYLKVRYHKLSSGVTGWFKKSDVKAYKTGGLVDYTGLAQVDGTTNKPELMLNAEDTKNFLELRDILREMALQELSIGSKAVNADYGIDTSPQLSGIADISGKLAQLKNNTVSQSHSITFGDTNINIDHVQDYNDFVNQLRDDSKFEKMIHSMTIDRISGRSSLAKNQYKW